MIPALLPADDDPPFRTTWTCAFLAKGARLMHSQSLPSIFVLVLGFASIFVTSANAQSQGQPAGILGNPLQGLSLDRLSASRDRPLFSPDRRPPAPPPPPVAPEAPAPPAPPVLSLLGTVLGGNRACAIVRSGSVNIERVQLGDDIGGWKVSEIERHRLVLSLDGRAASFTLFGRDGTTQSPEDGDSQRVDKLRRQSQQSGVLLPLQQAAAPQQPGSRRRR